MTAWNPIYSFVTVEGYHREGLSAYSARLHPAQRQGVDEVDSGEAGYLQNTCCENGQL